MKYFLSFKKVVCADCDYLRQNLFLSYLILLKKFSLLRIGIEMALKYHRTGNAFNFLILGAKIKVQKFAKRFVKF